MKDNNIIEITVVFANDNARKYVASAMADATVEAIGRLRYLREAEDSRAEDMEKAVAVLQFLSSYVAEHRTLDG